MKSLQENSLYYLAIPLTAFFTAAPLAHSQEIVVIDDSSGTPLTDRSPVGDSFHPISAVSSDRAGSDLWPASNLIQGPGTGFSASPPYNRLGPTNNTTAWVSNAPNGGLGDFFDPASAPPARLVFDLGAPVPLNEISLWGYNSTNANGASDVSLRFSDTTTFAGPACEISNIDVDPLNRQSFHFPQVTARYVEFVPTDNFFAKNPPGLPGGDRVGLSEVAFQAGIVDFGCTMVGAPVQRDFTVANAPGAGANLILPPEGLTVPNGYSVVDG